MNDRNITPSPSKTATHIYALYYFFFLFLISLCAVSSFRHIMKPIIISSKILLINGLVQNVNAIYVLI